MNEYELMMGLGVTDEEQLRAMADRLRDRSASGQMLSLSTIPQVQQLGQTLHSGTRTTAGDIASQRTGALNRARQAEQDRQNLMFKQAQERRAKELHSKRMRPDIKPYRMQDGSIQYGYWEGNNFVPAQTPEGLSPYEKPTSRGVGKQWYKTERNGVQGSAQYGVPNSFVPATSADTDALNTMTQQELDYVRDKKIAEGEGKKLGEWSVEQRQSLSEAVAGNKQALTGYENAISALEEGANTGTLENMIPSFRESTLRLEQAQKQLALDLLGTYKLTPVSNVDLMTLFDVAIPMNIQEDELVNWAKHKAEGLRRGQKILEATQKAAWTHGTAIENPNSEAYKELQAEIADIMSGYNTTYSRETAQGVEKQPAGIQLTRPSWLDEASWNSYTDEQKQELLR